MTQPALAIFASLLGHCWQAELTPQDVDTHCFTGMWNGAHVRDAHVVTHDGKPVYSGETIYSFDGEAVIFTYYNSLGGLGTGTAKLDGKGIAFDGSMRGSPGSKPQPITLEWRLTDDAYDVLSDGKTVRFRRVP